MQLHRRSLLTGLGAVICSPAIVRASSLMPVKVVTPRWSLIDFAKSLSHPGQLYPYQEEMLLWMSQENYKSLIVDFRRHRKVFN